MTTLLDSGAAPAQELAALYQSRWMIETTFAEMKTTLKGTDVTLRIKLGSLLAEISSEVGLTDEDCAVFDQVRDKTLSDPVSFE